MRGYRVTGAGRPSPFIKTHGDDGTKGTCTHSTRCKLFIIYVIGDKLGLHVFMR